MSASSGFTAATLLQPLAEAQQRLIDVIAKGFLDNDWQWPIFDYVEAELEVDGIDEHKSLSINTRLTVTLKA